MSDFMYDFEIYCGITTNLADFEHDGIGNTVITNNMNDENGMNFKMFFCKLIFWLNC